LINIPIFILFIFAAATVVEKLTKFSVVIVKTYYAIAFLPVVLTQITSPLLVHVLLKSGEKIQPDIISQIASIFILFTQGSFKILILGIFFILASTALVFIFSVVAIVPVQEYKITGHKKIFIISCIALLLCLAFAKGKISGHLTFEDSKVTSSEKLNKYAVNGIYKTARDIKKFNPANIKERTYKGMGSDDDKFLFKPDFENISGNFENLKEIVSDDQKQKVESLINKRLGQ